MQRAVRIALISEHASPLALRGGEDAGGQNVYVDEISRHLAQCGYAVDIFTRRDNPSVPEVLTWAPGVRIVNLTAGPTKFLLKDALWPYMPGFRDEFLRFMAREEVRYDLIHGNFWMSGWVAVELRRLLGVPVVQHFHALGVTKRLHQGSMDSSPGERIVIETEIVRQADRVIAPCPNEEAELCASYGADGSKVAMIPLAVNTDVFYPLAQTEARRWMQQSVGLAPDDFVVAYVGRMLPRKDVRNVVRAMALLISQCAEARPDLVPKLKLLVVGGESAEPDPAITPEIGELRHLADELAIGEHVICLGKRQPDILRYYYSAANVVVTTPWYEPFGLTPLEGMACARPVVGSAVGGITYTICDGATGFLVPPRDPHTLAARLSELLHDPALSVRMGEAARDRVMSEFTWPVAAARTAALCEEVIADPVSIPTLTSAYHRPDHGRKRWGRYERSQTA
jgi:D-inositol-3-phosphate glycosyltransferase